MQCGRYNTFSSRGKQPTCIHILKISHCDHIYIFPVPPCQLFICTHPTGCCIVHWINQLTVGWYFSVMFLSKILIFNSFCRQPNARNLKFQLQGWSFFTGTAHIKQKSTLFYTMMFCTFCINLHWLLWAAKTNNFETKLKCSFCFQAAVQLDMCSPYICSNRVCG